MKNRGQVLTFAKYPFGENIHWRAEKGKKPLLNLDPYWEYDQIKFTQHKGQSGTQNFSLEYEWGGAQAEPHAQVYPHLH